MEQGVDFVKIGIGVLIVVILVGIVFGIVNYGKSVSNDATGQLQSAQSAMSTSKYSDYAGRKVKGATVQSCIEMAYQADEVVIAFNKTTNTSSGAATNVYGLQVDGANTVEYGDLTFDEETYTATISSDIGPDYATTRVAKAKDQSSSANYIATTGSFIGYTALDANGGAIGIVFVQQ